MADVAVFGPTVRLIPSGGMASPYTRTLVWDFGGKGDVDDNGDVFATVQAALDYAGARASNTERYVVKVTGQGNNTETNLNVPMYVSLDGSGSPNSRFTGGTITVQNGRNRINGISITLAAGDTVGLRVVNDTAGGRLLIGPDVAVSCDKNYDGITTAFEFTGTAATITYIRGGVNIYAENDDGGASATCAAVRMMAGFTGAVEFTSGVPHLKTSASGGGRQIGIWRQTSSGGYYEGEATFSPNYVSPTWAVLNEGTDRNVGRVFILAANDAPPYTKTIQYSDAHATADLAYMEVRAGKTEVRGRLIAKGTWEYPFTLGDLHLWRTATGATSFKPTVDGMPSSDADGWPFQTAIAKRVTAAVALAASTTIQLPDLTLPVKVGQSWEITYMIPVSVTAGTAGVVPVMTSPAGTTGWFHIQGTSSSGTAISNTQLSTNIAAGTAGTGYITSAFVGWVQMRATLTIATDGNVTFALNTGASAAGSVLVNGTLRATRVT